MKKAELLIRERINITLSAVYDYPLTIVEAPMGFGKTTAVRSFLKLEKSNPLWISFIRAGESASYFWEKLSSEIAKIDENVAARLKALGFPNDVPQLEKVVSLLNDIAFEPKTVLVIDDFHLSTDMSINRFLLQISYEGIDNLHIIIITRDTTNIDFAELFAKGLCHVISQQKLKFNDSEIRDYCRMMAGSVSEEDLRKINEYTEGWISLIYLILLGLENGIPVGMNNSIDELVENVLFNVYEERIRSFLLKLSIMDVFTAKQALFVTQEEKAAEILKKLHKENAFVFYDQAAQTYKIHNVLLDYLRIKRDSGAVGLQELYSRLGEWYLSLGELPSAYANFNRAGDPERILSILNDPRNIRNELALFEGSFEMFEKLPQEMLDRYPIAYLQHIFLTIVYGNEETIVECAKKLEALKKTYEEMEGIDEEYRSRIIAEILIINKFTVFNYIDPGDQYNRNILRLLNGKQSYIAQRDNEFTFGSPHLLYLYFRDQGTLKEISEQGAITFTSYSQFADGCGTGSEYLLPAEYALETGNWEAAELNSFKAIYKAGTKDQTSLIICANFTLIRLYILQGKIPEAIEMLKQLEKDIAEKSNSIYNTTIDMCKGYLYACLGQPEKIPLWLQTGDMTAADLLYQGVAFNYIVYGKSVMLSKNYVALEVFIESINEQFSIFSNQLGFIHNYIFEAVTQYRLNGMAEGVAALERALSSAQPDNIILPFVENAPHILDMLKVLSARDSKNEYLKKIVSYSEQYIESLNISRPDKVKLSPREIEVLSLAAEGLKRDEIASRLFLSEGTVKTHFKNIFQKLEVSGKTAAIKAANNMGLLKMWSASKK